MKLLKVVVLVVLVSLPKFDFGQCDGNDFLNKCSSALGSYTFIKAFQIKMEAKADNKLENTYVFSKGSNYMIIICDENSKGKRMVLNLYDRNHKFITSSYNQETKKHYPNISYPCMATGVYFMETVFENDKGGCGVNILGFSKNH